VLVDRISEVFILYLLMESPTFPKRSPDAVLMRFPLIVFTPVYYRVVADFAAIIADALKV
jgi:hypothetical protein